MAAFDVVLLSSPKHPASLGYVIQLVDYLTDVDVQKDAAHHSGTSARGVRGRGSNIQTK